MVAEGPAAICASGCRREPQEAGDELLTVHSFPKQRWKTIRTTNVIERINEELRRRVETQGSLLTERCALVLVYSLVASGQINVRRIDGYEEIVDAVTSEDDAAAQRVLPHNPNAACSTGTVAKFHINWDTAMKKAPGCEAGRLLLLAGACR